jgi:hypothetical protein
MLLTLAWLLIIGITALSAQITDPWEDSLKAIIRTARKNGLPVEALENKIKEGHAKARSAKEIHSVVRTRKTVLSQISKEHHGTLPANYMHELFNREQAIAQQAPRTVQVHKRKTAPTEMVRQQTTKTGRPAETPHDDSAAQNKSKKDAAALKRIEKQVKKAERNSAKAAERALKRMEKTQKRLQKRMMKRRGKLK